MVALHTCKNEEDLIKNELTPKAAAEFCPNSLIQALIVVLITCKNEEDPIKN